MTVSVGYARQTRHGPPLEGQLEALRSLGIEDRLIFVDEMPINKRLKTPIAEREDAIVSLRDGETLVVTTLDRLGSDLRDMLGAVEKMAVKNARLFIIEAGFNHPANDLPALPFAKLVEGAVTVYRTENTRKARAVAKQTGKTGGRPLSKSLSDPKVMEKLKADWLNLDISQRELMRRYKASPRTLRRLLGHRPEPVYETET